MRLGSATYSPNRTRCCAFVDGLPIGGDAGETKGTLLDNAGLVLVPYRDGRAAGAALSRVLQDADFHRELREKSLQAHQKYFSWTIIASGFVEFLESVQP